MRQFLKISVFFLASIVCSKADGDHKDLLAKIQNYLNGVKSLQADMIQINPDQTQQRGRIYLRRDPNQSFGKLRLEYQPPAADLIVVDGGRSLS